MLSRIAGLPAFVLLLLITSMDASASRGSVFAITCPNCQTLADFTHAAPAMAANWTDRRSRNTPPLYSGTYIVTSAAVAKTAVVNVTGYLVATQCVGGGICTWQFMGQGAPLKLDGSAATTDDDLLATEFSLFGQARTPTNANKTINIDPMYGTSYINNSALDEDTATGVNNALLARNVNPNSFAVGSILLVKWQDGTTAMVIKQSPFATLLWTIIPGTARDKNGHPIDRNGNIVSNPNSTTGSPVGAADLEPVISSSPVNEWINLTPEPLPQGTITIEDIPSSTSILRTVYLPPGG